MKYLSLFIILLLNKSFVFSQPNELDINFQHVLSIYNDQENFIVIEQESNKHVHIYDKEFNSLSNFLRKGDGPGESRKIESSFFDEVNKKLYLKDNDGSILIFNLTGDLISEFNIEKFSSTDMTLTSSAIILAQKIVLTNDKILNNSSITVAKAYQLDGYDELYELSLTSEDLEFDKIRNVSKVRGIMLNTNIITMEEDFHIISIEGIPKLFVFNNKKLYKSIKLERFIDESIKITEHPLYGIGTKIPAINNNMQKLNKGAFTITYGNKFQEIPFGFLVFKIKEEEIELFEEVNIKNDLDINSFKSYSYNNIIYIFDNITKFANTIYIQ